MKDLLEYIIKAIVAEPDAVNITEENSDEGLLIKLEVAPDDKGAQALRTLLRVKAAKEETRVRLEIV